MADFRKWIVVLFALTLLAGLGSAQGIGSGGGMNCSFVVTPTLPIRVESFTDSTSDIVINCTGGQTLTEGTAIPTAAVTVTLNAPITSRLIAAQDATANASEALLMIDEPASGETVVVSGFGPGAQQKLCASTALGAQSIANSCGPAYVHYMAPISGLITGNPLIPVAVTTVGGTTSTPNVFQGVVSGNSVTFYGVPILPPGTTGVTRTFRVTNIRVDAPAIGSGPVTASVYSSNAIPLQSPTETIGQVLTSLTTKAAYSATVGYNTYLQCVGNKVSSTGTAVTNLSFAEVTNFASAFKTRVVPLTNSAYAGQANNAAAVGLALSGQATPGLQLITGPVNINSESDFIFPLDAGAAACAASPVSKCAGLADFGTRFKAVFTNIPTGVTLYASVTNSSSSVTPGVAPAFTVGGTSVLSYAQLVSGELAAEVSSAALGNVAFGSGSSTTYNVVALPTVNGSATAVWEVINSNASAIDTFSFPIYAAVAANTTPAPTTVYVTMSYAPTPNAGANFSASGAAAAQGFSYPIPRFQDPSASPSVFTTISICQTALLWPYVVTGASSGFETGLAISNTTTDPLGGTAQTGSCNLYFYGQNYTATNVAGSATATPIVYGCDQSQANAAACVGIPMAAGKTITSGQTWSATAGSFQASPSGQYWLGYVIGVCNFQEAHGYAAITDIGVRNIISSYLALVLQPTTSITRGPTTAETLGN